MRFSVAEWPEGVQLNLKSACFKPQPRYPREPQTSTLPVHEITLRAISAALEVGGVGNGGPGWRPTPDPPLEARSSRPEGIWISLLTDMSTTRYISLCFPKNSY